jgi:hypothetical protein
MPALQNPRRMVRLVAQWRRSAVMERIRDQIRNGTPAPADFVLGPAGERAVFNRADVKSAVFRTELRSQRRPRQRIRYKSSTSYGMEGWYRYTGLQHAIGALNLRPGPNHFAIVNHTLEFFAHSPETVLGVQLLCVTSSEVSRLEHRFLKERLFRCPVWKVNGQGDVRRCD